ncbi:hypothetical protein SLUN_25340 [Streptomyces lunaelactis]|uniref:Uncharacterized protein n=1 Tax=Streptomyces lunaelactis TaxID=1535768 RepID=A0A2R4T7E4_9ACTN|nr:hypothetical protein SLUN_25340 [Streptomyces lunaelactis]
MSSSNPPPLTPGGSNPLSTPASAAAAGGSQPYPRTSGRPYGPGEFAQTPLYAQLVAEWRARGAMLPGARDLQWDRLASGRAFEEDTQRTVRMLRLERDPAPAPPAGVEAGAEAVMRGRQAPSAGGRLPRPR